MDGIKGVGEELERNGENTDAIVWATELFVFGMLEVGKSEAAKYIFCTMKSLSFDGGERLFGRNVGRPKEAKFP